MIRIGWPSLILFTGLVALVARRPRLLFTRAFVPVLLVMGIVLFAGYVRGPRPPDGRG